MAFVFYHAFKMQIYKMAHISLWKHWLHKRVPFEIFTIKYFVSTSCPSILHANWIHCTRTSDFQTNDVMWIYAVQFRIPYIQTLGWGHLDFMANLTCTNIYFIKSMVCDWSGNISQPFTKSCIFLGSIMQKMSYKKSNVDQGDDEIYNDFLVLSILM